MELAFLVYLIGTVLPAISGVGAALAVITAVLVLVWVCGAPAWIDPHYEEHQHSFFKATKLYLKWAVPVMIVCSLYPVKRLVIQWWQHTPRRVLDKTIK